MYVMAYSMAIAFYLFIMSIVAAVATCNLAGYGFNGFDSSNHPKWDLVDNVDFKGTEFPTNIKEMVPSWNTLTAKWLRRQITLY